MYSPDERANIRAEMNRDAAPSAEEIAEENTRFLRENGCENCEETDPEKLGTYFPVDGKCGSQSRPDPVVYCDECAEKRSSAEELARRSDAALAVVYECGAVAEHNPEPNMVTVEKQTGWTEEGDPIMEETEMEHPQHPSQISFDDECYCGADITDVFWNN